jgi:hypothetical protein
MTYFSKFPLYLTTAGTTSANRRNQVIITDFFRRIRTGGDFSSITSGVVPYVVRDGYTPEQVSYEFYGSAFYHWVILLVNDIVNPREEWPLGSAQFNALMESRYEDTSAVHHYIDPVSGFEVDATFVGAQPVTVLEYESELNEAKRHIRMLDSKYLQQFIKLFDSKIVE